MCNGVPCNQAITSAAPTVTGGSCAATGGMANVPQASWAILGKACGDAFIGGGCGAGKVCQPKAAPPFLSGLCIFKTGDNTCPAGSAFSEKHIFYENFLDTRGCTTCQCGAPTGGSCQAQITVHSDQVVNTCNTQVGSFTAGSCSNLSGNPGIFGRKATITQPPSGSSCAPLAGGGQPTGSATPTSPVTFCCIP
jgi:hypothetical protein